MLESSSELHYCDQPTGFTVYRLYGLMEEEIGMVEATDRLRI